VSRASAVVLFSSDDQYAGKQPAVKSWARGLHERHLII